MRHGHSWERSSKRIREQSVDVPVPHVVRETCVFLPQIFRRESWRRSSPCS